MRNARRSSLGTSVTGRAVLVGGLALLAFACGGGDGSSGGAPVASQIIAIDGSSTVFPITEAVAEEFQKVRPDARVTVGISGTGGGFQKFCRGESAISDASRPIKPTEIEACAAAGIDFIELPVAYDGIALVVHPENDWVQTVTVAELRRIWEPDAEGRITRWAQIRTGWPDREIHLYGPGADSGTFDYFTEAIVGQEDASRGDFTSSEDDNVLVEGVASDALAMGFFGFAYYEENRDRLRAIPVDDEDEDNGAGPIAVSPDTIRDGTYVPLSRPVFIYVSRAALDQPAVAAFVDFYLSEAAALVREVGYVPLSEREYGLVRARMESGTPGTMFGVGAAFGSTALEEALTRPGS